MAYKWLMHTYEYFFDLPLTWTVETQDKHLRAEGMYSRVIISRRLDLKNNFFFYYFKADFISEGKNAERARKDFEQIRYLRDKVYIPKVYWDYTRERVLTCEWIDGVKVTDRE